MQLITEWNKKKVFREKYKETIETKQDSPKVQDVK